MIARCGAVKNYTFLKRFTTGVNGWIVIGGSRQEFMFYCIPYRGKIGQPDTYNIMGFLKMRRVTH